MSSDHFFHETEEKEEITLDYCVLVLDDLLLGHLVLLKHTPRPASCSPNSNLILSHGETSISRNLKQIQGLLRNMRLSAGTPNKGLLRSNLLI